MFINVNSRIIFFIFLAILLGLLVLYYSSFLLKQEQKIKKVSSHFESNKNLHKAKNIVALVFYGRKRSVSILIRYLERNFSKNGGILDKVIFAVKTKNRKDLDYLNEILKSNSDYYERFDFGDEQVYKDTYSILNDDDLVFKIDDDIVFISNGTFEKMVEEYLTKNLLILSANVVNHPLLSHVHSRLRAILPFIETSDSKWIKAENISEIDDTVAMGADYGPNSKWWRDPKCAAIAHESFLYHVYNNNLDDTYNFKLWDFNSVDYPRWSINFILTKGSVVNRINSAYAHIRSDEVIISIEIPKKLKRHSYALGSAIVSHFSYFTQIDYLSKTGILDKYEQLSRTYLKL